MIGLAVAVLVGGTAAAQTVDVGALAVQANEVNLEYCPELYMQDVELAAKGYQRVAQAWEAVDAGYREVGSSSLLYWRGVLAQCLGQHELALEDLSSFVRWTEGVDDAELAAMVADAETRVRRLETAASAGTTPRPSRRRIGAALSISGGAAALAGFTLNLVAYERGTNLTDQAAYESTRTAGISGLVVGFAGAGVALAGLLMAVLPQREGVELSWVVGPVTSLTFRF